MESEVGWQGKCIHAPWHIRAALFQLSSDSHLLLSRFGSACILGLTQFQLSQHRSCGCDRQRVEEYMPFFAFSPMRVVVAGEVSMSLLISAGKSHDKFPRRHHLYICQCGQQ
mmetsp:Transcript_180477/g.572676  ORF Transcript_180477/g.572676 Transcript_180477/m.572676 type:complete len:112 (-) Transcript_180477:34-369(-)